MGQAKPHDIPKRWVWEAYKRVKANRGAAGVDEQSIEVFEADLQSNLYKLWNRMSSGSYFPPPVKRVQIDKRDGGKRPLGIPTVSDRVAQAVVKGYLEPDLEKHFHPDSFGYRPGKSALDAVGVARQRCWRHPFVLDLDIRAYFDSISHELLLKAIRKHTDCAWVLLYIERWLKAPVQLEDGTLEPREKGTPQGSVVSPLMANLFLHYTFDMWMRRNHPSIPFERYADDILCHCDSERQAQQLKEALAKRFAECGLELHPDKTKIVYCKDDDRRGDYPEQKFDFLGYTFRARRSKNRWGKHFVNFSPGVSNAAAKAIRQEIRAWQLRCRVDKRIDDLARMFNPIIRGWMNYYGRYYKSALYPTLRHLDRCLARWAMSKYKRLRRHRRRAEHWVRDIACRTPTLLAHWPMLHKTAAGR
ncbi:group II intron reverse transcriptase/maturase [Bradyrhizobium sp. USDA 3458]|uniref:group II intron reverse transcriptase/maturase n=1 Tax=Bradyrhizobium sp. USDA 3458 TaxID=2591461 RepID=UPI001144B900|nr:group II intron reverse transcriptase/maturase [Bradyrhizobium sp. USDA 3458]